MTNEDKILAQEQQRTLLKEFTKFQKANIKESFGGNTKLLLTRSIIPFLLGGIFTYVWFIFVALWCNKMLWEG